MMSRKIFLVATVSVSVNHYIRYLTCFKHSLLLDIKFLVEFNKLLLRRIKISIFIKTAFPSLTFIDFNFIDECLLKRKTV